MNPNDLDQGGTPREWVKTFLGPSVGWVYIQQPGILTISAPGTYTIPQGVTDILVNVNGAVTLNLPSAISPAPNVPAITVQPATLADLNIADVGGFGAAQPITIVPFAGELIMGLSSIQITTNYGGYALKRIPTGGWASV